MNQSVINVSELHCSYGGFEAVRGVGFDVGPGELFALLGTNGAGKTTTMETIEGHRAPTGGKVRVFGMDPMRDRARVRPRVGIMLQHSGFAGDLTVAETVRLWQSMVSRPSAVDPALEALGLKHRRNVRVKQLSGGERRRLDLVLATLGNPEVLFLDEPTTGLDPESRKATWEIVRNLLEAGTTVLLTTHYLEEAERLAHRLAIMHDGRIAVSGSLTDVLATQRARIEFELPEDAGKLPDLAGEIRGEASGRIEVRTDRLQHDLHAVLAWARERDVRLSRLRAQHASLDDVFHAVQQGDHQQDSSQQGDHADIEHETRKAVAG
ncbi:ABC-2 type transport system ATP-binding protein [Halopolyspora algeriensis]|uniref:ABC-2 type transport system ATP-binding protein n=1 Tax=Halopolyspora algeriensis TaxID=1500506 RepID=A0A368VS85_9ACTN|nr:ABC transporter ATP-binding protein [Halopolyspora algeriensis]RCW43712.1 ABC-2 type transport system ATP-binding protein [Halopolyspora algeriensis]TQM47505.1 ABC-2 type transport system ATP-binding protein [Halopolyspora algeriensis]